MNSDVFNRIGPNRTVLSLAVDVHMHSTGALHLCKEDAEDDVQALKEALEIWGVDIRGRFNIAVRDVILAALDDYEASRLEELRRVRAHNL